MMATHQQPPSLVTNALLAKHNLLPVTPSVNNMDHPTTLASEKSAFHPVVPRDRDHSSHNSAETSGEQPGWF